MADFGQEVAGTGINTGIGFAANRMLGNLPVPLPSFYNSNSSSPWANSQAVQMLHGNPRALAGYGEHTAGMMIGGMLGGPLGAMAGGWLLPKAVNWASNMFHNNQTPSQTTVTVGPIGDGNGDSTSSTNTFDPGMSWTAPGAVSQSAYGPYAGGYQFQQQQPANQSYMPDFSQYGNYPIQDTSTTFNASTAGTGDGGNGGNSGMGGGGMGGGFGGLPGGGNAGYMNGASMGMQSDFAAPTDGDATERWVITDADRNGGQHT